MKQKILTVPLKYIQKYVTRNLSLQMISVNVHLRATPHGTTSTIQPYYIISYLRLLKNENSEKVRRILTVQVIFHYQNMEKKHFFHPFLADCSTVHFFNIERPTFVFIIRFLSPSLRLTSSYR